MNKDDMKRGQNILEEIAKGKHRIVTKHYDLASWEKK